MKRVKEDMSYIMDDSGAIVLDNQNRYLEHIRQKNLREKKREEYESLKSDVEDLKIVVKKLLAEKKAPAKKRTTTKKKET